MNEPPRTLFFLLFLGGFSKQIRGKEKVKKIHTRHRVNTGATKLKRKKMKIKRRNWLAVRSGRRRGGVCQFASAHLLPQVLHVL